MTGAGCTVVTAAGAGIGRATALRLAADSETALVALDLSRDDAEATVERVRAAGSEAAAYALDCTDRDAVRDVFAEIEARHGPVAGLVNGVGSSGRERAGEFHALDLDVAEFVVSTSLMSAMYCTRQVVAGMRERRAGTIVCIASGVGQKAERGLADYSAAKAGVIGLMRSLALELAPFGVRVNAVSPGAIRTAALEHMPADVMASIEAGIPCGRVGEPEEIAAAIAWLMSEDASYVFGHTLSVNGGWHMA